VVNVTKCSRRGYDRCVGTGGGHEAIVAQRDRRRFTSPEFSFPWRQEAAAGVPALAGGAPATKKDAGLAVLRRQAVLLVARLLLLNRREDLF